MPALSSLPPRVRVCVCVCVEEEEEKEVLALEASWNGHAEGGEMEKRFSSLKKQVLLLFVSQNTFFSFSIACVILL